MERATAAWECKNAHFLTESAKASTFHLSGAAALWYSATQIHTQTLKHARRSLSSSGWHDDG